MPRQKFQWTAGVLAWMISNSSSEWLVKPSVRVAFALLRALGFAKAHACTPELALPQQLVFKTERFASTKVENI